MFYLNTNTVFLVRTKQYFFSRCHNMYLLITRCYKCRSFICVAIENLIIWQTVEKWWQGIKEEFIIMLLTAFRTRRCKTPFMISWFPPTLLTVSYSAPLQSNSTSGCSVMNLSFHVYTCIMIVTWRLLSEIDISGTWFLYDRLTSTLSLAYFMYVYLLIAIYIFSKCHNVCQYPCHYILVTWNC